MQLDGEFFQVIIQRNNWQYKTSLNNLNILQ